MVQYEHHMVVCCYVQGTMGKILNRFVKGGTKEFHYFVMEKRR